MKQVSWAAMVEVNAIRNGRGKERQRRMNLGSRQLLRRIGGVCRELSDGNIDAGAAVITLRAYARTDDEAGCRSFQGAWMLSAMPIDSMLDRTMPVLPDAKNHALATASPEEQKADKAEYAG